MSTEFFILMKSELSLVLIIFLLLFFKLFEVVKDSSKLVTLINVILTINFLFGFIFNQTGTLFSGMYITNELISFEKSILNLGTLIISLQAFEWLKQHKHLLEFYILLLATLLGMNFMISSGNFLIFYLGLELASIPLAALVNFDLHKLKSSEAATKMILSSAFASGIMLFGISLLYGVCGSLNFIEIVSMLSASKLTILSVLFIFTGFAFKLSIVPFHFWTADVYEGAPMSITAYLSVISKGAIVFVFISILSNLFLNLNNIWFNLLSILLVITVSIGNLFALRQDNLKRFLAYSSIAQVGFILLGLSPNSPIGNSSVIYFLVVYLFSNLGVFGVVTLVSSSTGKENISDLKGFYTNNKTLSWILAIALFSLAGVPPTAGFFGKMFLITSGASKGNYFIIICAALNMVISLYYYLNVVKVMFVDKNEDALPKLKIQTSIGISLIVCILGVLLIGFSGGLFEYINLLFA